MQPQSRKLLEEMRDAAADITSFTSGKSSGDYLNDKQLRYSVERAFEIIGEALSQLNKLEPATAARISEYRKIISFRNVLIHGYGEVDNETTWDIVKKDVPILQRELET